MDIKRAVPEEEMAVASSKVCLARMNFEAAACSNFKKLFLSINEADFSDQELVRSRLPKFAQYSLIN